MMTVIMSHYPYLMDHKLWIINQSLELNKTVDGENIAVKFWVTVKIFVEDFLLIYTVYNVRYALQDAVYA